VAAIADDERDDALKVTSLTAIVPVAVTFGPRTGDTDECGWRRAGGVRGVSVHGLAASTDQGFLI
jgi:hypothetical protein